jgi:hypothetical protein
MLGYIEPYRVFKPFNDAGDWIPTTAQNEGGFRFIVRLNAVTILRCTEAGSVWRIVGPYSAVRPALKVKFIRHI